MEIAAKCLTVYRSLMADDEMLMSLFGKSPGKEEIDYVRSSFIRFSGDTDKAMGYLRKVADIVGKGEALGNPTREIVVQALEDHGLDQRKATQMLREEHHRRRDLLLKEQYKKNKEREAAEKAAAAAAGN